MTDDVTAPRFHFPTYNNRRGNTVAFGAAWFDALSALNGDEGARQLLKMANINWVDWHNDIIYHDVDMPSDLTRK